MDNVWAAVLSYSRKVSGLQRPQEFGF
jgi:hypothetical protein